MREIVLTLAKKENKRRLLAALFLVFFLAEMGSHVVICANHPSMDERSISSSEGNHDDPCKTLVLCGDSGRRDKQLPKMSHDASQHNALLDLFSRPLQATDIHDDPPIPLSTESGISRPPDPAFHPPELN